MTMFEHLRHQARACSDLGSPMYAELLDRVAADVEEGGPLRDVLAGHEADPGPSALGLRLLGSVHRLVLERRAGELATFYPSVGGTWEPEAAWTAFRDLVREHPGAVTAWIDQPPQTNEVGRAGALMGGLLRIGETHRLPVRLVEIGASGGLNLRADRFCYVVDGAVVQGPADSPVRLEQPWRGRPVVPWPDLEVVERLGCDTEPVDVSTTEGRLTLTSYVWPDQVERLSRLRHAFAVAEQVPAEVRRADAASFVRDLELREGTVTVLWHSVMWQYLPAEDRADVTRTIEGLGAAATPSAPFAHLYAEPARRARGADHEFLVELQQWPGGVRGIIGTSVAHGLPTVWE
jgi:hypothetical protein